MKYILALIIFAALTIPKISSACDLCSIYFSLESHKTSQNTLRLGVSEQFTVFDTLQDEGAVIENELDQHLNSSITQIFASYDLDREFSLQTNIPLIYRSYKRVEENTIRKGSESGIGDISLLVQYSAYRYKDESSTFSIQTFAGVKIPTGDSSRLKEELEEQHNLEETTEADTHEDDHQEIDSHSQNITRHGDVDHSIESAIHGHDLALGSGSWDFPVGINLFAQKDRFFAAGSAQYVFRTEGKHSYKYDEDFNWSIAPAYYLVIDHGDTLAVMSNLSGEYKGNDRGKDNITENGTSVRSVFLGPQIMLTLSDKINGIIGVDWPLDINNTGIQTVPTYRVRAGLTFRF